MSLENNYLKPIYEDFGGIKLSPSFKDIKKQIEEFNVREQDVWVTSYPRSGTTWCQELVWLICNNMDYEGAKEDLDLRFPFIEHSSIVATRNQFVRDHNIPSTISADRIYLNPIKLLEKNNNLRYIKSHLPWEMLPKEIVRGTKKPKIVHVIRNPKQIVPSYYHLLQNIFPMFKGTLEQFVDAYIKGDVPWGSYFTVVLSYLTKKHLPNLLIISYEEMYSDIKEVIKKISKFLGKSYTEEEIDKLSKHLNFEEMRENRSINKGDLINNGSVKFFRKGVTDSYKTELSQDDIKKLDNWIEESTKGIEFPYKHV